MAKRSKAYRAAAEKIDRDALYSPLEAVRLAKETATTKYDATVEVAFRLGVDPRKADQMVRGTVNLPARHRQDRPGHRLRHRRACRAGPRRRRRRGRWRRADREGGRRLHRLRRGRRHARPHGQGRSARQGARARAASCRTRRPAP